MSKEVKYIPITDLLTDIIDNRGKSVPTVERGFPLIATNCIKHSSIYPTFNKVRYVSENTLKTWFRAHIKPNDILFVNKGTPGRVCLVPNPVTFCAAQDMMAFRSDPEKINYKYLFAVLRSNEIQKKIENNHVGLVIPHFRKQELSSLLIPIKSKQEQKAIGDLYIALSEKIELNNRINSELEAMAKTLYDYWFVQFDFPDKNGKPYKTSGGKMGWNEELKREIPEGWQVIEMSKLLVKNNVKYDYKGFGFDTIDLSVMPSSTMCLTARNHSDSFSTNLFYLKKFDILFGAIRPYLLKAGLAPFDGLVTGTVHSYRTIKKDYYNFALLTMIQESVFKHAISNSKGTKMPVIGSDDLLGYKVPFDEGIIIKFNESFSFKEIIAHNINENQKLTELRDWLLPMLMNGQVKVN